MTIIKKIDSYVLKKFLLLFVASFFVCLFVLIMQFLWRNVDDLIGKGLSVEILAKFFWYASITLVPMALPLSILLASLISFGNMGEQLELTAMKAAGIPLRRIMVPIGIFSVLLTGVSFVFQNNISPNAQKELARMIVTMKETSPAIEIPEGMFYSGIPNVNIYVDHKNAKTGMLYKVIIYKMDQGFQNAQIVVADSARLETTADKHFLRLEIFDGEQFENLRAQSTALLQRTQVPYDRETFHAKTLLINFDSDFDLLDADMFSGMAKVKNLTELSRGADSILRVCDSIGKTFYISHQARYLGYGLLKAQDSARAEQQAGRSSLRPDTLLARLSQERRVSVVEEMQTTLKNAITDLQFDKNITRDGYKNVRKHLIQWHQKFALSLSCIIFFFIGTPLGAIIRKGGLGLPTVVSVIIFIIYYVIDTSGMKLARDGAVSVIYGMWISTMVLAPLGAFLTYKANNDSVVFNLDAYMGYIRRFLGIRTGRFIIKKDVIIQAPDYPAELERLDELTQHCRRYVEVKRLPYAPSYVRLFFKQNQNDDLHALKDEIEALVERLSNSTDARVLDALNKYPEIHITANTSFSRRWLNLTCGILLPLGLVFWFRIWRFRIRLFRDLKVVEKQNERLQGFIQKIILKQDNQE